MAVNYESVLAEMRAAGLLVDRLEVDSGRTVRRPLEDDREKRGWYRLSTVELGGQSWLVGAWGVWRGNDNGKVAVKPDRGAVKLGADEQRAISAKIRSDNARAKKERELEAERAAAWAAKAWRQYEPSGHSAYLDRKRVGAHGLRFHPAGTVAVPMMDARGRIWGLQVIRGPDRGGKREKEYWPKGLHKQGRFHLIGGIPRGVLLIAEGYATAASLHEATGLSVAVAFDAGNLLPVAEVLAKEYGCKVLLCADDDFATDGNPGVAAARTAALAVDGRVLVPSFGDERQIAARERIHEAAPLPGAAGLTRAENQAAKTRVAALLREIGADKLSDFNDLAVSEGVAIVRAQVDGALAAAGWRAGSSARVPASRGDGDSAAADAMTPRLSVEDAVARYWGTYGFGGKVLFDEIERRLVHIDDVRNLLPRHGMDSLREHPDWRVARDWEIGFDPSELDPLIRCNLYAGWPTQPVEGRCDRLLEMLQYLCSNEPNGAELYQYVLRWLALPIQRPGAKMHSAVVIHGPQGTGKSLFFESYLKIYGPYGIVLGQEALEDKFNADWAEKKLFVLADEVLARQDMFHTKNRLKGFITGDTIRVNPKNVAAHKEKNCMNIVFLSNERQPLVIENDDRRHCVIWSPPALPRAFFDQVLEEIDAGGIAALHHHLKQLDLGDFRVGTRPPMSQSKQELIQQSASSEERFVEEWIALELEWSGQPVPFCPCLGTDLYKLYSRWCDQRGERRRRLQDLIGHCGKRYGWRAGRSERTWESFSDRRSRNRKLVVPDAGAVAESVARCATGEQAKHVIDRFGSQTEWLTNGFFAFASAITELANA